MTHKFIPVAAPVLAGNERKYVDDCIDSTWISSNGKYVNLFERAFAEYCGVAHAITCCNGTAALHLALVAAGVGKGDEVIVPTLTYVATANAVRYCGAKPVFVDVCRDNWTMDPSKIEASFTERTTAIIPVSLYGHPCDMDPINAIARAAGIKVIEDAAEAHGAEYKGRKVGSLADMTCFSFFGNKIMTTGEGGMVTTDDDALAAKLRLYRGQGVDPNRRYWHPVIGFNYRMTNICAAIGLAQLERIDELIRKRRMVRNWYLRNLCDRLETQGSLNSGFGTRSVPWMFNVLTGAAPEANLIARLAERNIETRPIFFPVHTLPPYTNWSNETLWKLPDTFPVAEYISSRGISLPTWAGLTEEDVNYVCDNLKELVHA